MEYRELSEQEIDRSLFRSFIRRQIVTKCWRKEDGVWLVKEIPFIDDWTEADYQEQIENLKHTVRSGGFVYAAFYNRELKGFVSVEKDLFGSSDKYLDLSSIYVSEDMRQQGIGAELFSKARQWAKEQGADKLYISAHSAIESQAFYRKMGCVEAKQYNQAHVEKEPCDCQLECVVSSVDG